MPQVGRRAAAAISLVCLATVSQVWTQVSSMDMSSVRFVDKDGSLMIATSNYNYGLSGPKLAGKSWRTVSVNGDSVSIVPLDGSAAFVKTKSELGAAELAFIETTRDELGKGQGGFTHMSTSSAGDGSFMMSSSQGSSSFSSSASSAGAGLSTVNQNGNGVSVSMKDDSNFSISKSDLPYNWSRVFFNGELATVVSKDGAVDMRPMSAYGVDQADKTKTLAELKEEVKSIQKTQSQQASATMQNSMNMVSNVFDNIMGRLPKPPNYQDSLGSMFGNNFPFGNNNNPFSASAGFPFSQSQGGAFAFAGRRRR